jgi:hypothetical protein
VQHSRNENEEQLRVLDRAESEIAPTGSGRAHSQAGADCQIAQKTLKNELINKLYVGWGSWFGGN